MDLGSLAGLMMLALDTLTSYLYELGTVVSLLLLSTLK
jgi:hypothetical protein